MVYDELNQGLVKVGIKASKPAEDFTWGQTVLFGDPEVGTDQDVIDLETEVGEVVLPSEAVKGVDPTRVNYGVSFDQKHIYSQYFFPEDTVDLSSAKNRIFGEPADQPWSTEQRILALVAKKRDAMAQGFRAAKEKMAFDCALNGKYATRGEGEQAFPVSASLLSISGANLTTKPFETINAAAKTLFENGVILKRIVLNPTDGANLAASTAWQTLLDKRKVMVGELAPQEVSNGLAKVGTLVGLICGSVDIYVYAGFYGPSKTPYLPQGKALLLPANAIGRMGYTGVLQREGDVQGKVAAKELFLVYGETKGNLVTTKIQGQTAPAALMTAIDGYGVMTNIA